ncbi:MAG: 16S rRNA processing protein RimM [Anaerolineae bacterium]|nr:16S rRNA processing protein RimM [Anaerolineae bacterium]
MTQASQPYYLILGEILRPHGVRGELRVRVLTDYPERVAKIKTVYIGNDPTETEADPYSVQAARLHQDYLLLKLAEIADRNEAETLRGLYVMIDLENAVPLEEDEFYLYEVIGLRAYTQHGEWLGTVNNVIETGANDVYVVNGSKHGELLLPIHEETLVEIDFDEGKITLNLPDGLLPDATDPANS